MDVRKPKAVHSLREFALELLTIVIGVSIALGGEALVERHRVHEALTFSRADFRAELRRNRNEVATNLREASVLKGQLEALIREGSRFVAGREAFEATDARHNLQRSFVSLRSAAWSSALSTQVMTHFPPGEGRAVAQAYSEQEAFTALQQIEQQGWFQLALYSFVGQPTKPQVLDVVQHVTVALAYLNAHLESEQRLLKSYDAALAKLPNE